MLNLIYFNFAVGLYAISTILYFVFLWSKKQRWSNYGYGLTILSLSIHTLSLVTRGFEARHLPMSGMFETLVFFGWMVSIIFCFIEYRYKLKILGVFVVPVILFILVYGYFLPREITPLVPALQSYWLGIHVGLSIFSYGTFVCAFDFGLMFIIQDKALRLKKQDAYLRLPSLDILDNLSYKSISIGFPALTAGIITGCLWADSAWGSYWTWDPKETWSLITWFVYAAYLHARFMRGWRGKKTAYLTIIGFGCMLFTFLGVNLLLPGLHTYK
ncbi:MAG: c-type cytochrome biogenesis protein CcsB [bacterium]|nr:c-type cytochrome biogenesis protein CcsB [bacterium]